MASGYIVTNHRDEAFRRTLIENGVTRFSALQIVAGLSENRSQRDGARTSNLSLYEAASQIGERYLWILQRIESGNGSVSEFGPVSEEMRIYAREVVDLEDPNQVTELRNALIQQAGIQAGQARQIIDLVTTR